MGAHHELSPVKASLDSPSVTSLTASFTTVGGGLQLFGCYRQPPLLNTSSSTASPIK